MRKEIRQAYQRLEGVKKIPLKVAVPAIVGAGILFPSAVYTDAAFDENPQQRSEDISNFLDNRQTEIAAGVLMTAGLALTLNSYYVGRRNDERPLHLLRVSGPALLTAAAGTALVDAQTTINYAIPAGLTYASTLSIAADNIINTFQGTRRNDIRLSSLAANAGIAATGATVFLAAADKL